MRHRPHPLLLLALVLAVAGCATNGRHVLLRAYRPCAATGQEKQLAGLKVHVVPFTQDQDLLATDRESEPAEPDGFTATERSDQSLAKWEEDRARLHEHFERTEAKRIGHVRNGFGMVMSHVYCLNQPGEWLHDAVKLELAARGATLVDQAAGADLVVGGHVVQCQIDMYMKYWVDLVVDYQVAKGGAEAQRVSLHTTAGGGVWSSSSHEYFMVLRQAQQKQAHLLLEAIGTIAGRP